MALFYAVLASMALFKGIGTAYDELLKRKVADYNEMVVVMIVMMMAI